MKKYISFFTLTCMLISLSFAQDKLWKQAQESFYQAYLAGDSDAMISASTSFKQLVDENPSNLDLMAKYLQTRYSIVGYCMEGDCKIEVEDVLNEAISMAEAKLKKNDSHADLLALYGGMLGMKIGLSPMQGMFLGPKSAKYLNKAFDADPGNPLAYMFQAFSSYNTPAMFGGSIKDGQQLFAKSAKAFEERGETKGDWGYLDALAWNGIALNKLGNKEEARASFNKALEVAPNFGWIKYSLMPSLSSN